jgi:hypothetical protein
MTLLSEKIVVTAKEYLKDKNFNDSAELNEAIFQAKLTHFDWDPCFAAASIFCEIVWKKALGGYRLSDYQQLDRLFSPSPIATHANFRGNRQYKTGSVPEEGAMAVWRRGNSCQGHMEIVSTVSEDRLSFDVVEARVMMGSGDQFFNIEERPGKKVGLPFKNDKLNLVGFIYAPKREID